MVDIVTSGSDSEEDEAPGVAEGVDMDWTRVNEFSGDAGHNGLHHLGDPGRLSSRITQKDEAEAFLNFFPVNQWSL